MTNLIRAAVMGALMTVPLAGTALAAETSGPHDASMMATMVCRSAAAGETATATTADAKKLVCKPVAAMMKTEPKMTKSMTAKQMNDALNSWTNNVFAISPYQK